ncbi:hypothetical protein [Sphingomonas paucimobilis]|uniref:Uncharacterized protein n=1 Tax=Sphingomonas paucimobilis TaxID=13689 RepID=A0A7Y2KTB6_SPHPI|nr:hypothetical protein [Sphingomonas paucimobilis]NNG59774.1 hypothetical protein [Sphingomonas paucimobilis]
MFAAKVALPPKCEAPRQTRAGVERGTTNFISSNVNEDSTAAARLQRLNVLCGVSGRRAELIAFLIWGEAQHG